MDHTKEEANRARETAKKRFLANDFPGARKFALKAQFLNPDLEGIAPMVATFDVHVSAQNVIHGEVDYYGILGVNPEADDETVRKRYRKLAVMLHPDRNKSVGAEEAFKFLSQAWGVFSDKGKRAEYDLRRNLGLVEGRGGGGGGASSSSAKHADNGFQRVAKASVAKVKSSYKRVPKRGSDASASATAPAATSDGTFWTVCRTCRTQYEYHRVYLNQNLLCPNCRKPFIAVETDPPGSGSIRKTFHEHQFESIRQSTDGRKRSRDNNNSNGVYDSFEWSAVCTGTKTAGSRKDEGVVRREYTRRVPGGAPSTNAPKRRKGMENAVAGGSNVASCFAPKSNTVKEFSDDELKNLLKRKAKPILRRKLQEIAETDAKRRRMGTDDVNVADIGSSENKSDIGSCCVEYNTSGTVKDLVPLEVTDPDFCDFNKDRTEKSFRDNQIWACYDSLDGMPRGYVMIDKVISVDPFKVCITQLTSDTNSELRTTKWLGFGVSKACGDFRGGKTQICKSPYIFSHKVEQVKGNHGEFLIYPRRGDVWALYRNWSHEWNYLAGGEAIEYDVVEVVEGYTEEYGVTVVPLMKVAGFKSVFHHHLDPKDVRRISRDELSRFSHRIPSYLLAGREAPGAPRGCIQLDPAATPSQLLQVIDL
ncbi:F132 [Hirschfeldia incana]|nr:F132 [Hirschfeldia incana]